MKLWAGNLAAVSLTFDDAMTCQLLNAVPILETLDLKGTFFLPGVPQPPDSKIDWSAWVAVGRAGHEIGSHSMTHPRAASLSKLKALDEAQASKEFLENRLDCHVDSFCYPYTDAWEIIQTPVKRFYRQARGGRIARADKFIVPGDGLNLFDVPAFHLGPSNINELPNWVEEAIKREAWFNLMIHGVGEAGTWDNIEIKEFSAAMKLLARTPHLWVAPFGKVAENLRNHA